VLGLPPLPICECRLKRRPDVSELVLTVFTNEVSRCPLSIWGTLRSFAQRDGLLCDPVMAKYHGSGSFLEHLFHREFNCGRSSETEEIHDDTCGHSIRLGKQILRPRRERCYSWAPPGMRILCPILRSQQSATKLSVCRVAWKVEGRGFVRTCGSTDLAVLGLGLWRNGALCRCCCGVGISWR